jgi:hypothetical protein
MARKCIWLIAPVILGTMLVSTVSLAQTRKVEVGLVSAERLSDKELNQIQGQGAFIAPSKSGQPINAIKLWDECLRPESPAAPTSVGQNQVIQCGPRH